MKKSLSKKLGILFILVAFVATLVSVVVINSLKQKDNARTLAAAYSDGSTSVSAKFAGDVLFSAEKVLVSADNVDDLNKEGSKEFKYDTEGNSYKFENYWFDAAGDLKYVVEDSQYVKLDNKVADGTLVTKDGRIISSHDTQEAILISFGHYYLNGPLIDRSENGEAKITRLNVSGKRNNVTIEGLERRDITHVDGPFFDFAYLITQATAQEGYYEFTFEYTVGGENYTQTFGFNLLFDTSYTQIKNEDLGYTAQPVLGWTEGDSSFKKSLSAGETYIRYYDGENGISTDPTTKELTTISYPTITYDYMKYRMSYTHTYNKVTTTYTYTTSNTNGLELNITSSSVNGTTSRTQKMQYYGADASGINLVSILFTKPGVYKFSFDYLYNGIIPNGVEFDDELNDVSLIIHGLELQYSKVDYQSATLRHFVLSVGAGSNVDLVVANGVQYGKESTANSSTLDFVYTLDVNSTERVGNVINSFDSSENKDGSRDALINAQLHASNLSDADNGDDGDDYTYLTTYAKDISQYNDVSLGKILDSINYVKTNQGSFWFNFQSDAYNNGFYFYSTTKPSKSVLKLDGTTDEVNCNDLFEYDEDESKWKSSAIEFNNQTSFNKIGYYLVFMKVKPINSGTEYYQVFAFQYSADSVDIKAVESTSITETNPTGVPISNYTKENVTISWQDPDVFEKKLTASYYIAYNNNLDRNDMLSQKENTLSNGQTLGNASGNNVADGQFAKILVKIENDSKSATYRMFTIDRAKIEDVYAYVVKKSATPNGDVVYSVDQNTDGSKKVLRSGITDSYVSLNWQETNDGKKKSGAEITAEYYYVPFVKDNSITVSRNANNGWISTKYKLGTEIGPFADYIRPTSASQIRNSGLFTKQGIYRVILTDEAGNSCQYLFVIDNTEAYYQVTNDGITKYYTGEKVVFTSDASYTVGTYKNISLDFTHARDTENFVKALTENNQTKLNELGYYSLDNAYTSNLTSLFSREGTTYNLIVKNNRVAAYDSEDLLDNSLSGISGTITDSMKGYSSSAVRHLYLYAKNNEYSSLSQENLSYLTIEVNTDNSMGKVYYSGQTIADNSKIPTDGKETNEDKTIINLETGSDNENSEASGIIGAHATSATHLVFTWKMGVGDTAVAEISYTRYPLNKSSYDGTYYFFDKDQGVSFIPYTNNTFTDGASKSVDGTIGYLNFDIGANTPEGLYVVTRTYSGNGADNDAKVKTYYFIVDRSGIIESTGDAVNIKLLESETTVTNFNKNGDIKQVNHIDKIGKQEKPYNFTIYLTTNKVPAVLSVPVGKIISGNNFSNYYAGRLTATLYYAEDVNSPFGDPIYKGEINENIYTGNAYYYRFDIATYLYGTGLYNQFIKQGVDGDWLYKPGVYALVIEDNVTVLSTTGVTNNKKIIGFQIIQEEYPTVDFVSGYQIANLNASTTEGLNGEYTITTNEEYVEFTIPSYDSAREYAQVDPNYLEITATINNGNPVSYLNLTDGTGKDKTFTDSNGNNIKIYDNGKVNLNTRLAINNVTYKQTDSLVYKIKIRFELGMNDKYIECYTIDGKKYYESVYTVEIDRTAPDLNIKELTTRDAEFIKYYNDENGVSEMFSDASYQTNSARYYVKQYTAYYSDTSKTMSKIYAFNVSSNDVVQFEQDSKVRYRSLSPTDRNLTLPVLNENEYVLATITATTYGQLFENNTGIYEVIEIDKAGNVTQYVVNYTDESSIATLNFDVTLTDSTEEELSISSDVAKEAYNIVNIEGRGETFTDTNFFRFELTDISGTIIYDKNTNFLTRANEISTAIASKINLQVGNYTLKIINPYFREDGKYKITTTYVDINLYKIDDSIRLNREDLVVQSGGKYYIDLVGANRKVNGVWYYATEITVNDSATYKMTNLKDGQEDARQAFEYQDGNNQIVNSNIIALEDGVYKIVMKDVLNNEYILRFSTTDELVFYSIKGADNNNLYYQGDVYYAFNNIRVYYADVFNNTIDISYKIDGSDSWQQIMVDGLQSGTFDYITVDGQNILISPYFNHLLEVTITFDENESYNIVIDGIIAEAELREYLTGDKQDIIVSEYNQENPSSVAGGNSTYGRMTLLLNKANNGSEQYRNMFIYTYKLYQEGKKEAKLITQDYETILTDKDASEQYWLVVEVYAQDGTYLGNKVHAFKVYATNSTLYTIQVESADGSYHNIDANSTFTYSDLPTVSGIVIPNELQNVNLPLYIINTPDYEPSIDADAVYDTTYTKGRNYQLYEITLGTYTYELHVYTVKTDTYSVAFGVLIIPQIEELVSELKITVAGKDYLDLSSEDSSIIIPAQKTDKIELVGNRTQITNNSIINKNLLKMDVCFGEVLVRTVTIDTTDVYGAFTQEILGNGEFVYVIYDLAGNVQKFEKIIMVNEEEKSGLEIIPLREVVIKVKTVTDEEDYIPLDNAFYSEEVELRIYSSYLYKNGSIQVIATRNGEAYELKQSSPYLFSDYGTYRVTIKAVYVLSTDKTIDLSKTIMFTIVNKNEARKSMDLSSINGCNITKVLNTYDEDITDVFKYQILAGNSYVSYDKITEFAKDINTTFGKNKFTIMYEYDDGIYPKRELSFAFTLNNEIPEIECSIKKGETTTKGFDISFNEGIIYEQIGEAFICINDRVVAEINAESTYDIKKISTTFKEYGAGDYYVQIITASGNIISSYKVTIKEPLNVWAIVIIVVVSVVVITVTTVILVLRHRMKIR